MGNAAKVGLVGVLALMVLVVAIWDRSNEEKHRDGLKNLPVTPLSDEQQQQAKVKVKPPAEPAPQDRVRGEITHGPLSVPAGGMNPGGKSPATRPLHPTPAASGGAPPPSPEGGSPAPSEPVVAAAPARKTYTIKPSDTLSAIAAEFYGNRRFWKKIADANKDVIRNPDHLPLGKEIVIPPLEIALNETPGASVVRPSLSHTTEVMELPAGGAGRGAGTGAGTTYTVQHGDTLSLIAQKTLGSKAKWRAIWDANREKLPTENSLREGQQLAIPAGR